MTTKDYYGKSLESVVYRFINETHKRKSGDFWKGWRYPTLDKLYDMLDERGHKFDRSSARKRNITKYIEKHLVEVVIHERNFVGLCTGKSGLGKSYLMIAFGFKLIQIHRNPIAYIDKLLKKYKWSADDRKELILLKKIARERESLDTKLHFSFNFDQSQKEIKSMTEGDTLIQDEFTELKGEGSKIAEKDFNNLIRQFRYTQKNFILNNPDYFYFPNLHLVITPIGQFNKYFETKNPRDMKSRFYVRFIDDTEKTRKAQYIGYGIINIASVKKIMKMYEKAKDENYKRLEKSGGGRTAKLDIKQLEEEAKTLWKTAKDLKWKGNKKKTLGLYLQYTDINYDSYKKDYLIDLAWEIEKSSKLQEQKELVEKNLSQSKSFIAKVQNRDENKLDKQKEQYTDDLIKDFSILSMINIDIEKGFLISDDDILKTIPDNPDIKWENIGRDIEIFKQVKDGRTHTVVAKEHKLDRSIITRIRKRYQGYINKHRGHLFELYYETILKKDDKYDIVVRDGARGKPDIYAITVDNDLYVFSCKCLSMENGKTHEKIENFEPEIRFALENHINSRYSKIKVKAVFFDSCDCKLYKKTIDFLNPPKTININKDIDVGITVTP